MIFLCNYTLSGISGKWLIKRRNEIEQEVLVEDEHEWT
jgi:hypothetical protein